MSTLPAWPAWARIDARVEVEGGPPAVRADMEGPVAQGAVEGPGWYRRTVTAELGSRLDEFRTWAEAHAGAAFTWRDRFDGVVRPVRVEGGAAGIVYRQVRTGPGTPWWTAEMVFEGIARPWPAARSVWSQEIDLGDASHVYFQQIANTNRRLADGRIRIVYDLKRHRLPDAWTPTPPLKFGRLDLNSGARAGAVGVSFSAGSGSALNPGPQLTDVVREGLAFAVRSGTARVVLRIPPSDTEEPYFWDTAGAARAGVAALTAAIPDTDSLVEMAICWAGAGSVVDLTTCTTTENGSAPALA